MTPRGPAPSPPGLPASDPEPRFLRVGAGRIAYVDEGPRDAPAVLAVHGLPGSLRDFRYLAPQLTGTVRLVRIDLPGFGGSPPAEEARSGVGVRARVLRDVGEGLGLDRYTVLGHSMGGATALVAAAEDDRVEGLVLVASVALRPHRGLGMSPGAFRRLARGLESPLLGALLAPMVGLLYRRRGFKKAPDRRALTDLFRAIGATDFAVLARAASLTRLPTLLCYAHDDPLVERAVSEELARAMPHARVVAFAAGGHHLPKTRAVELAEAVRELLGRARPPAVPGG